MTLSDDLINCEVAGPLNQPAFIPVSCLEETINARIICNYLPWITRFTKPRLANRIFRDAKKLFAILVLIEEPYAIDLMVQEGLTDDHLPLSAEGEGKSKGVLVWRAGDRECKKQFFSQLKTKNFLQQQWTVQAPVFEPQIPVQHFDMDANGSLPLIKCEPVVRGFYADVFKGVVHPAHHKGFRVNESNLVVAVKEFKKQEAFDQERENLVKIQPLNHNHLVEAIATCSRDRFYYVIFPWAEGGNLGNYWRSEKESRNQERALWSLRQMLGICQALEALHKENCRHGDLKPENVLHFTDEPERLVLADVGVSRFHQQTTNLRNEPTNTRATTPIYEAPEAQPDVKDPRSRRYDMWSMGCLMLEHVVWLLYGHNAMVRFRKSRRSVDPEIRDGSFYKRVSPAGTDPASASEELLHPRVSQAFEVLRTDPNCAQGTALGDLLDLIFKNLMVDIKSRAEAGELVAELSRIVDNAQTAGYFRISFKESSPEKERFLAICPSFS